MLIECIIAYSIRWLPLYLVLKIMRPEMRLGYGLIK